MISFFTAPAIVIIPIAGALADRFGRKPVLITALLVSGSAGTALASTTDYRWVLLLRLLQGVGFAGIVPILITSIGDIYTGQEEATGQGLRLTVVGLSATLFPVFAGALVEFAWQYPFLLYAIAFPVALVVFLWFDELDNSTSHSTVPDSDGPTYRRDLFSVLRRRHVWALMIARSLPMVIWIGFITYNSLIVIRFHGGTAQQAGFLAAIGSFGSAIAASQAGRITDIFESRFYPLIMAHLCLGAGFGVLLFSSDLSPAVVGIAVSGFGLGITGSLYRSIITGLGPEYLRAGIVSVAEAGGRITVTLTPIIMGGIVAGSAPVVGLSSGIRLAGVIIIVIGGIGGILCLLIANAYTPAPLGDVSSPNG